MSTNKGRDEGHGSRFEIHIDIENNEENFDNNANARHAIFDSLVIHENPLLLPLQAQDFTLARIKGLKQAQ